MKNSGKILQVIGPVVDVEFPTSSEDESKKLPKIYEALEVELPVSSADKTNKLVLETHQHIGGDRVRAIAMGSTDGLRHNRWIHPDSTCQDRRVSCMVLHNTDTERVRWTCPQASSWVSSRD